MINIAITGAGGRMGKTLIEAIMNSDGIQLTAAIENPESTLIGADVGELSGVGRNNIQVVGSLLDVVGLFDVLIDFSIPASTVSNAEVCQAHRKRIVVGTTGLTEEQTQLVSSASQGTAICMASNFATGVNLCFKLAEIAASVLGDDVDIGIRIGLPSFTFQDTARLNEPANIAAQGPIVPPIGPKPA